MNRVELRQSLSGVFAMMEFISLAAAQAIATIALDKFVGIDRTLRNSRSAIAPCQLCFLLLAQSLNTLWSDNPNDSQPGLPTKMSEFFRQSPLAKAVATGELDLGRDRGWRSIHPMPYHSRYLSAL